VVAEGKRGEIWNREILSRAEPIMARLCSTHYFPMVSTTNI